MHVAAVQETTHRLLPALAGLQAAIETKSREFKPDHQDRPHPHTGCDAAYARPGILRLRRTGQARCERVRTAPERILYRWTGRDRRGTGLNADPRFGELVAKIISTLTSLPFTSARTNSKRLAAHDAFVFLHGALTSVATALFKIANDIRLLGSGPRSGIGELILPENEPGSSIMRQGQPTQSEALTMVCCQCFGNHTR